jgi:tRNA pseudouridine38-40 synthase
MLARISSLLSRSRTAFRAMSSTPPTVNLPEKRSAEEIEKEDQNSDSTSQNQALHEETDKPAASAAAKRIKTAKERKDHFDKKQSWKARDWSSGGKKPVRDGPAPERRPKKKVAVLVGFCGTGYQGMQMYVC